MLDEAQAGINSEGSSINNLKYADDITLWQSKELKTLLMKVKEESEKVGLKLKIQKRKIMASICFMANRWGNDGTVTDLTFLATKMTENGDFSHEIERHLFAPWKKSYDQPRQCIKKQRHYLAKKGPPLKAMVFPVLMYGCESCTVKKAEG